MQTMAKNGGAGGRVHREDGWIKQGTEHPRPLQQEKTQDQGTKDKIEHHPKVNKESISEAKRPDGPAPRD